MPLRLNGSTSGYSQLDAPAIAGDQLFTLPAAGGTFVTTTGTQTLTNKTVQGGTNTLATAVNPTSGTSIDFTGIPSWVNRITVMFNQVSTNGNSHYLIQLGSGSITASGYNTTGFNFNSVPSIASTTSTAGFVIVAGASSVFLCGSYVFTPAPGSINGWIGSGTHTRQETAVINLSGGLSPNLAGALDRVRITTVNGTDAFDTGIINILYEG